MTKLFFFLLIFSSLGLAQFSPTPTQTGGSGCASNPCPVNGGGTGAATAQAAAANLQVISGNPLPASLVLDGQQDTTCTWAASSTVVSCTGVTFSSGKSIVLKQAGAAIAAPGNGGLATYQDVTTTISSVTGSGAGNTANLAATLTTASGAGTGVVVWGTDNQTALLSYFAGGGTINLPNVWLLHSGVLYLPSYTQIFCQNTQIQALSATTSAVWFGTALNAANTGSSMHNCTLSGVTTARNASYYANGVTLDLATSSFLDHNIIQNFSGAGIIESGLSTSATYTSGFNVFNGNKYSGNLSNGAQETHGNQYSQWIDNVGTNNGDVDVEITEYSADTLPNQYTVVRGNTSTNSQTNCLLSDGGNVGLIYDLNHCFTPVHFGLSIQQDSASGSTNLPTNIQVSSNDIHGADSGNTGGYSSIYIQNLTGGKFEKNWVYNGGSPAYYWTGGGKLKFDGNKATSVPVGFQNLGNTNTFQLINSVVDGTTNGQGIVIGATGGGSSNCNISGNTLNGITLGGFTYGAIDVYGTSNCTGSVNQVGAPGNLWAGPLRVTGSIATTISLLPVTNTSLATPAAPTTAVTGATGTTYTYDVQAFFSDGTTTVPGATATASAAATLNGTSAYVTVTTPAVTAALYCAVRRVSGGSATAGIIGFPACGSATVDAGQNGDGSTAPSKATAQSYTFNNLFIPAPGGTITNTGAINNNGSVSGTSLNSYDGVSMYLIDSSLATVTNPTGINLGSTVMIGWAAPGQNDYTAKSVRLASPAANTLVESGSTAADGNGIFGAGSFYGTGTVPTISNGTGTVAIVSTSTQPYGTITSSTTGTVTFTMTFGKAYPHRPVCSFRDETTTADVVGATQSTTPTTTTLTVTGTTVSGDIISYACGGY